MDKWHQLDQDVREIKRKMDILDTNVTERVRRFDQAERRFNFLADKFHEFEQDTNGMISLIEMKTKEMPNAQRLTELEDQLKIAKSNFKQTNELLGKALDHTRAVLERYERDSTILDNNVHTLDRIATIQAKAIVALMRSAEMPSQDIKQFLREIEQSANHER